MWWYAQSMVSAWSVFLTLPLATNNIFATVIGALPNRACLTATLTGHELRSCLSLLGAPGGMSYPIFHMEYNTTWTNHVAIGLSPSLYSQLGYILNKIIVYTTARHHINIGLHGYLRTLYLSTAVSILTQCQSCQSHWIQPYDYISSGPIYLPYRHTRNNNDNNDQPWFLWPLDPWTRLYP